MDGVNIDVVGGAKSIGGTVIWDDMNVSFAGGGVHVLTGSSGSGKSTLLNCIGLIDRCTAGQVLYDGTDLNGASGRTRRRYRRDRVGYLFQDYALVDYDTVRANIGLAMVGHRSRSARREAVDDALERVGLAGRGDSRVFQLSGGQKQRVALARLLVRDVAVVLADEPTGALDRDNGRMVLDLLQEMAGAGACVVSATHDPWVVERADTRFSLDAHLAR